MMEQFLSQGNRIYKIDKSENLIIEIELCEVDDFPESLVFKKLNSCLILPNKHAKKLDTKKFYRLYEMALNEFIPHLLNEKL